MIANIAVNRGSSPICSFSSLPYNILVLPYKSSTRRTMAQTSLSDLTAEQALHLADSLFVDEFYEDAIDAYTAAEAVLRQGEDPVLHYRIRSHRAAAFLSLERFQEAFDDCSIANKSLEQVTNLRAGETEICWRRQGIAALKLKRLTEALSALEQAQQLAILNQSSTQSIYTSLLAECHAPVIEEQPAATEKKKPEDAMSPVAASPPPPAAPQKNSGMPKYQFWQSDKFMTISILEPNVQLEQLDVNFQPQHLSVILTKNNQQFTVIAGKLWEQVEPDACQIKLKAEKVLLKLKKSKTNYEWPELMSKETIGKKPEPIPKKKAPAPAAAAAATKEESTPPTSQPVERARPYASHKDWDSIEKDIEQEEAKETPQGDDAMNKLFQQIYQGADEDTRRAMIKSYQTSGGTVLSTNWNEVQEKDYEKERTAPKGMEWKNWEGDKLKQEDD